MDCRYNTYRGFEIVSETYGCADVDEAQRFEDALRAARPYGNVGRLVRTVWLKTPTRVWDGGHTFLKVLRCSLQSSATPNTAGTPR
jgi:hypothetical protein